MQWVKLQIDAKRPDRDVTNVELDLLVWKSKVSTGIVLVHECSISTKIIYVDGSESEETFLKEVWASFPWILIEWTLYQCEFLD